MKKLLLILCLFSMTAHAEWNYVSENNAYKLYINYNTILNESGYKSAWFMRNFNAPQEKGFGVYQSAKDKQIFDCKNKKSDLLTISYYSQKQGDGASIKTFNYENSPRAFESSPPDTIGEDLLNIVCKYKK